MSRSYSRTHGDGQRLWTAVYRDVLQHYAQAPLPPPVLRLLMLTLGGVEANGHCPLGDPLHVLLGVSRTSAYRTIRQAVALGVLDDRSCPRCLVLPPEDLYSAYGSPSARCNRHPRMEKA